MPLQRPLFLEYPDDPELFAVQDQYLYGPDMVVAPVIMKGAGERDVVLPGAATWRHLWSGRDFAPGTHTVPAPIGTPPVFYRADSAQAALFASLPPVLRG